MTDSPRGTEAATYLAEVRRHLADLPPAVREDLLADLEAHLNEVAADLEPGATLAGRLGAPAAYAAELRETVVVEGDSEPVAARRDRIAEARAAVARTADAATRSAGMGDFAEFREKVRPGWWAVRGAVGALLLLYWFSSVQYGFTDFWIFGSFPGLVFGLAAVLLGVWISLRIGTASTRWGRTSQLWTAWLGAGLMALAAYQFAWVYTGGLPDRYVPSASYSYDDGSLEIEDLRAYDENGEPIDGFYLFDQNGDPVLLGDPYRCDSGDQYTDPYGEHGYLYPLCPTPEEALGEATPSDDREPTAGPSESPTADETTEAPEESPSDEPDPTASDEPTTAEATPSEADPTTD
ncbi:HAAS signaling domain-containing protein [Glycomyces artemisiae]|uniref:Putative membrane protein n=2 Tax=Glycomyces artemisiae TaxID=1076443 RepID=A0A2T0UVZ1_9ACTN|nr:hypothetical protein [Glycomyces artemisiae]PRY62018.1 putative membrane protein [Glycomyces artemisiae]